jgi:hypothetical protein
VSPLWRDEIGILLAPRRLVLARVSRGLRPRRLGSVFCNVPTGHIASWEPALIALRAQLAEPDWRNANVRVIVADHWVRYMVVPWVPDLNDETERITHARHLLSQAYGEMDDWILTLGDAAPGKPVIATALPGALLTGLMADVDASGNHLISTQPHLAAAFNAAAPRLPRAPFWFVSVNEGSLAAAHVTADGWDRVHAVRIGNDWNAELRRLRLFGRFASGNQSEEHVFVHAPVWLRPAANEHEDGLQWLNEDSPSDNTTVSQLTWLQAHNV